MGKNGDLSVSFGELDPKNEDNTLLRIGLITISIPRLHGPEAGLVYGQSVRSACGTTLVRISLGSIYCYMFYFIFQEIFTLSYFL